MNCSMPDCFAIATIDLDRMPVCKACDHLIRHPEIDDPDEIERITAKLNA